MLLILLITAHGPAALQAYSVIVRQEGIKALWTGTTPNILRNSVVNAAELATYDQVGRQKPFWLKGWKLGGGRQWAQVQDSRFARQAISAPLTSRSATFAVSPSSPACPALFQMCPPALQIKQALMHPSFGFQDNVYCHLSASLCAGFIAVSCASGGACWASRQWAVM